MLDLVPLAGARREVTDLDRHPCLVGQALQLDLPQARRIAVGTTAVCGDRQRAGVRVALPAKSSSFTDSSLLLQAYLTFKEKTIL